MLPLKAGDPVARFLSAGGVYGVTPGTYLGTATSTLTSIDNSKGDVMTSEPSGSLHQGRWYGSGVALPTGGVWLVSVANRDHVDFPGSEVADLGTEFWTPQTGKWSETAAQTHARTYHNSAILMPDGRVLVGGHAPIGTFYGPPSDGPAQLGLAPAYLDPTFQVFSPPYLFWGPRPALKSVDPMMHTNSTVTVEVEKPGDISSIRLVRNGSYTHLINGDQRTVELNIVKRDAKSVKSRCRATPTCRRGRTCCSPTAPRPRARSRRCPVRCSSTPSWLRSSCTT
ncbi:MAG TPA: galactose oxidase-like domain-containing protein [Sporichthyaceae bacterium]|jgi:hypothetical protein|nr:galactose oxidase-like domain-containing protein [Sporichthyaceae bacterium]